MTKDTTIKIRVSAEEKANWELQAEADGVALSELVRRRMNSPVTRADGPPYVGLYPKAAIQKEPYGFPAATAAPGSLQVGDVIAFSPYPRQLHGPNRTNDCEHGRAPFVFCATCDSDE